MQQNISLKLLPAEAVNEALIIDHIAQSLSINKEFITGFHRIKQSVDARSKQVWITLTVKVFINEPFAERNAGNILFKDVSAAKHRVIIVGAGPAGLYAALKLIEQGIKPIIIERGKRCAGKKKRSCCFK